MAITCTHARNFEPDRKMIAVGEIKKNMPILR